MTAPFGLIPPRPGSPGVNLLCSFGAPLMPIQRGGFSRRSCLGFDSWGMTKTGRSITTVFDAEGTNVGKNWHQVFADSFLEPTIAANGKVRTRFRDQFKNTAQ